MHSCFCWSLPSSCRYACRRLGVVLSMTACGPHGLAYRRPLLMSWLCSRLRFWLDLSECSPPCSRQTVSVVGSPPDLCWQHTQLPSPQDSFTTHWPQQCSLNMRRGPAPRDLV